jgi:phage terminase small subunit
MSLKPKQEKFAQLYVELGNASEAYRQAYSSKAKAESVNVNASKLLADAKVSLRVQQLRDELEEKSLWKRLDSIKTLASIADGTDPEAKVSDRVNAVKALNSMHGWDKQVIEHSNPDGSLRPTTIQLSAPNDHSEN